MGAGVTLWPNAGFVLADLELLDEVLALGGTPAAMHRYDAQGRSLGGLDIEPLDRLMGYPTCAILRTDLQAVLLRRAREAGVPVAFGREATAIANDPDGRAVVHFADGGRLSRTWSSARTDACPRWRGPMWPAATRRSIKASSTGSAWPKARATWWTALPSTTIGAWRARRHRGAGAAQGLLGGRAGADAGAGARVGGRRAGRRVAQGAPPVRELARSHRRGHRCHAAAGPAPDRGARPGAAGPLASRQCAAGGRRRARALPRRGRAPARRWRMPGIWRAAWRIRPWGRARNWSRRWNGSADCGGRRRRPSHGRRGTSRELFITDPQACRERDARVRASDPLRRACVGARLGAGPAFAGAGAGRSRGGHRCRQRRGTVAVTSATSWLGGRGEA